MYDPKKDPAFTNNPYLTDYGSGSYLSGPEESDCQPCYQVNPPWWCNDTQHPCYNCCGTISIDPGFLFIFISALFGVYLTLNKKTMWNGEYED
jgi:hypothetical protein